ncbi:MAG TPA: hypothetical protein VEP46_09360 [Vicinamibacterales bacterium]|nr:hypothetical protein [Vicinamibacterales bacterium]
MRQEYLFGGARNEREALLKTANRLLIAERGRAGSIAAFPPPHNGALVQPIKLNVPQTSTK